MLKKIIALLLCMGMMFPPAGLAGSGMTDQEIIDCSLELFSLLAAVPHPSLHEEKIAAFLMEWVGEQGISPVRDKVGNIMFEVPATAGMENKPLCALQGHMDMVVAVADGKDFDPENDPIPVVYHEDTRTLTADGTSLGADDGAGCVLIMAAVQGKIAHGPLRILLTVDEEDTMSGAMGMDASWLEGVPCLINLDNEATGEVLVSSAAGDDIFASATAEFSDPEGSLALTAALSGLQGGHSGVEINKGRLNGLIGMGLFLKALDKAGIRWDLASFDGGTASNAIPTGAVCTFVIHVEDREAAEQVAYTYFMELQEQYAGIEDSMAFSLTEAETIPQTVSETLKNNAVRYLTEIIDGVYTMSTEVEGLVESSSNLGIFRLNRDGLYARSFLRSSSGALELEIRNTQLALAAACGFEAAWQKTSDAWPVDPGSRMTKLAGEVYSELTGKVIVERAVHAGLECGTFKLLNPAVDMISIGPDIHDPHTVYETLDLDSMVLTWRLLEGILAKLD